jgi:hypothetical protein
MVVLALRVHFFAEALGTKKLELPAIECIMLLNESLKAFLPREMD